MAALGGRASHSLCEVPWLSDTTMCPCHLGNFGGRAALISLGHDRCQACVRLVLLPVPSWCARRDPEPPTPCKRAHISHSQRVPPQAHTHSCTLTPCSRTRMHSLLHVHAHTLQSQAHTTHCQASHTHAHTLLHTRSHALHTDTHLPHSHTVRAPCSQCCVTAMTRLLRSWKPGAQCWLLSSNAHIDSQLITRSEICKGS